MKKEQKQQPMQIRQVKPDAPTPRRKRVAAYCRVSTGKDAMLHSLSRQISHYSAYPAPTRLGIRGRVRR